MKFCEKPDFREKIQLLEYVRDQLPFIPVRKVWSDVKSPNYEEQPIYIRKWSNCEDQLVFKLNSQTIEQTTPSFKPSSQSLKVLQVVNKSGSEIVLRYNAGKLL